MTLTDTYQIKQAKAFKQLHYNGRLLVLPNVWDPLGAALLENTGYTAIATASASIAYNNGYPDGERIPFKEVITILKKITAAVTVPVTADIESGYADDDRTLAEHVRQLLDTGIAGINFEDTDHKRHSIRPVETQCSRINCIRNTAAVKNIPLFINARTDVYLHNQKQTSQEKLEETIRRGKAYINAGADGFYPILMKTEHEIESVISQVNLPLNILLLPGIPHFNRLQQLGVARLSLGPGFLKIAINAMKNTAEQLLRYEGMEEIMSNPVTSDYLASLTINTQKHEKN